MNKDNSSPKGGLISIHELNMNGKENTLKENVQEILKIYGSVVQMIGIK